MHASMTPAPGRELTDSSDQGSRERRPARAMFVLYAAFFFLWCIGLAIGLMDEAPVFFGMPLWFLFSCVFSYVLICFALIRVVRRFF